MTNRLYYMDSYTTQFSANVVEKTAVNGQPAVVLDVTYFYPTSGGQPHDLGTINAIPVTEVIAQDQGVLHVMESLPLADQITAQIDWPRRFDHMRQHSGQHLLSRAFEVVMNAETASFHLSDNSVTIDLEINDIPLTDLDAVENLVNQIIAENRSVRAWFPAAEELASLNLRKISDKVTGAVRVVDMGGFDICACGGTHVAQTGEIGLLKVIKLEKNKKGVRVEFRAGQRSLEDYRQKNALLLQMSNDLTVGYWEVPAAIDRLRNDTKNLQKELKAATSRLLQYEAEALWQAAGGSVISQVFENREAADLQGMISHLILKPRTTAFLAVAGEKAHIIFGASEDSGVDVVPLLKGAFETIGAGRGGGKPTLAQGGGFPASREQLEAALAEAKAKLRH